MDHWVMPYVIHSGFYAFKAFSCFASVFHHIYFVSSCLKNSLDCFQADQILNSESGLHLIRRTDGSLKLEYTVTEPGLHSIMIMVNGKHVHGKHTYVDTEKLKFIRTQATQ